MRVSRPALLATGSALVLLLAACGEDETSSGEAAGGGTTIGGEATIAVESSELGPIVVDAEGRTLYLFLPDEAGASTCYDDCAANWPALTVEGDPVAGEGVDATLLGTADREDGAVQVTYGGWPLYRFAADETADDVNGQGVGEVWYVVSPEGAPIQETAETAGNGPGYGYGKG